eukprot:g23509.t1
MISFQLQEKGCIDYLHFEGTQEVLTLPLQICTKIQELKHALSAKLGYIEHSEISFVVKQGCTYKRLQESDQA